MLPVQCRMARAALLWGIRDLARKVGVSPNTIARFEHDDILRSSTVAAIERILESAGIEFIAENGGGPGVRLAKRKSKPKR